MDASLNAGEINTFLVYCFSFKLAIVSHFCSSFEALGGEKKHKEFLFLVV